MTEDEARRICTSLDALFSIRKRRNGLFVYVSRWLPKPAAQASGHKTSKSNGQQFERYVCTLPQLNQLDVQTLRSKIAALPHNPNKLPSSGQFLDLTSPTIARWHAETETPGPKPSSTSQAFLDLLATIPLTRTGILIWAAAAGKTLSLPREQLIYRLALYREQLADQGVILRQSTRHRVLFVPTIGSDEATYYSHIWREKQPAQGNF